MMVAPALIHHLAIGRNIPLADAVAWLIQWAPCGVIEFVGKSDPQVQRMLRVREDIFDGYTRENFLDVVRQNGRIFTEREVSQGRLLVWYSRQS